MCVFNVKHFTVTCVITEWMNNFGWCFRYSYHLRLHYQSCRWTSKCFHEPLRFMLSILVEFWKEIKTKSWHEHRSRCSTQAFLSFSYIVECYTSENLNMNQIKDDATMRHFHKIRNCSIYIVHQVWFQKKNNNQT